MKLARSRTAVGAAFVSMALLISACGTSGGDADKKSTTTTEAKKTTTTAEEETTTTADTGDAEARAKAVKLSVSDFPSGWSSQAHESNDDDSGPFDDCDPSFKDDSDELATFTDDNFVTGDLDGGDGSRFGLETKVFTDATAAKDAIAPFGDADVLSCMDEKLKAQFETDGSTVDGEFSKDDGYPGTTADETLGASANYTVSSSDGTQTLTVIVAVLLIRTGDLASQVVVLSVGDSLDPTVLQAPIEKVEELQAS